MDITLWGPGLWELIHTIAFNYNASHLPANVKKIKYINFFTSLGTLIPCEKCKKHYNAFLKKYPIGNNASSYNNIIIWANNLHNNVNVKLGKSVFSLANSKKKYVGTRGLVINHFKILNFINNSVNTITIRNLETLKTFLNSILYIYPCESCRKKIVYKNKKNKSILGNITSVGAIKLWYRNLLIHRLHT